MSATNHILCRRQTSEKKLLIQWSVHIAKKNRSCADDKRAFRTELQITSSDYFRLLLQITSSPTAVADMQSQAAAGLPAGSTE
jgi:hypothetical protein